MRNLLTVLIGLALLIIFSCKSQSENPTLQPLSPNSVSERYTYVMRVVDSPFNRETYLADSAWYLEKYSELIWNEQLDSLLCDSTNLSHLNRVRKRFGSKVLDVDYMRERYPKRRSMSHVLFLCSYGRIRFIDNPPPEPYSAGNLALRNIKCGMFEHYIWDVDSMFVFIYYLRKGKDRLPYDARYGLKSALLP